jgi:predicted nucleic acid-binding protein
MRIVLDTNVFVSAALKESSWPAIVVRWVDRNGMLLRSAITAAEVVEVLQRPRFAALNLAAFRGVLIVDPATFGRSQVT